MTTLLFDFIRDTSLLTDEWCASFVAAQQRQADEHFTPAYGIALDCKFIPPGGQPRTGAIQIWWKDRSEEQGALGFHSDDGSPKGIVGVQDCIDDGVEPSVTTSHETLETAGDPDINKVVDVDGEEYSYEVCDAPEDDRFGYEVEGLNGKMHLMSAFVLPSWFKADGAAPFVYPPSVPITAPLQLASGGYIGRRQLPDGQWTQVMAEEAGPRQIKRPSSRTRRRFARDSGLASAAGGA